MQFEKGFNCRIDLQLKNIIDRKVRKKTGISASCFSMVGTAGFEPATPSTPRKCATKLRYVPLFTADNIIHFSSAFVI